MKKQVVLALLGMLMVSVLPGCGKSKNNENSVLNGGGTIPPVLPGPGPSPGPQGGCYDVRGVSGSGITLGFGGTLTGSSGLKGNLQFYGTSGNPGYTNMYWRTTVYGDRTDIAISGSSAYVQATVSSGAISLVKAYGGEICGFYMNVSILNPAITGPYWSGNVGGGTFGVYTRSGYVVQL